MHVRHALKKGDPCGHHKQRDDTGEYPPIEREAEKGLRGRQERDPLGALQHSHARRKTEPFRASVRIRSEKGGNERQRGHDDHGVIGMYGVRGIKHHQPAQQEPVGHPIEGRVVEGSELRGRAGPAGHRPIEDIEERRQAEEPTANADVPCSEDNARGTRADGTDGGDGVRTHTLRDQPVRHGGNDFQVSANDGVPKSFHQGRCDWTRLGRRWYGRMEPPPAVAGFGTSLRKLGLKDSQR